MGNLSTAIIKATTIHARVGFRIELVVGMMANLSAKGFGIIVSKGDIPGIGNKLRRSLSFIESGYLSSSVQ